MLVTRVEEAGNVVVPELMVVVGTTELSGCEVDTAEEELSTLELAGLVDTDACVVESG